MDTSKKNTPDTDSFNPFNIYSSKIPRIHIPLPEFKYYHKISDEIKVDKKFIGREPLSKKLKNWLLDGTGGSYLVTGYRGMGKSSFVGKVLHETCHPARPYSNILFVLSVLSGIIWLVLKITYTPCPCLLNTCLGLAIGLTATNIVISYLWHQLKPLRIILFESFIHYKDTYSSKKGIGRKIGTFFLYYITKFPGELKKHPWRKYTLKNRLIIKISLGHEILNERDILCLISKNIYHEYKRYLRNSQSHLRYSYIFWILVGLVSWIGLEALIALVEVTIPKLSHPIQCIYYNLISISQDLSFRGPSIPYIKILTFGGLILLFSHLLRMILFHFNGVGKRLRELEKLNDRIDASVNEDKGPAGVVSTSVFGININRKRNKVFPQANVREIESELLTILKNMNRPLLLKSRFIIIFDELDKIDPIANYSTSPSENLPEFRQNSSGFPEGATSRKRKQNVLNLLANMKLFMTASNVKFIFISGRELYDAFLADLSDREFAISSIFNGVLYVDSFLSSSKDIHDVSSMTENYICKQLIPRKYFQKAVKRKKKEEKMDPEYNLKLYYEYLTEEQGMKSDKAKNIIILLYHFSVYLSHISNGSPKKISLYFEQHIKTREDINQGNFGKNPGAPLPECPYYLSFGYTDQRKIGFIHYIAFPTVQTIINHASQYGDKLLVSASFLIDHIYKFHNHGFSWRNLEYTPELLEVYRTPELRKFIETIVSSLKQTHLIPIHCGLYQLKFRKKISEEISMLSKFFEEISAIFNFTLDESLSVKKHYFALLKHYENAKDRNDSIQSIASIHHILGDLYMADEEYNEAIFEYQKSLHILSNRKFSSQFQMSNVLSLIRIILKLGLTYELRHTYNSAYVIYSELINRLINYRYLDEKQIGLRYVQMENENQWFNKEIVLYQDAASGKTTSSTTGIKPEEKNTPNPWPPRFISNLEDIENLGFYTKGENILTDIALLLTPEIGSTLLRLSLFEDIRLIYQALLAKLFVLEKIELGGITQNDLKIVEAEYAYLHITTNEKEKFIISADFFRKLAEIMYYKNTRPTPETNKFFANLYFWEYDINIDILDFCRKKNDFRLREKISEWIDKFEFTKNDYKNENEINKKFRKKLKSVKDKFVKEFVEEEREKITSKMKLEEICKCMKRKEDASEKCIYIPCHACRYYTRSLKILARYLFNQKGKIQENSKSLFFYKQLSNPLSDINSLRTNCLSTLGYSLEGMGNVLLSCAERKDKLTQKFLKTFLNNCLNEEKKAIKKMKRPSKLEKTILYYWDAYEAFKLASNPEEASASLKKILSVFLNYLIVREKGTLPQIKETLLKIMDRIVQRALQNLYSQYEYINITEIQTIKWLFSEQMYNNISLQHLTLFPDIEQILLISYEIRIRLQMEPTENDQAGNNLANLYTSNSFSSLRHENTVSGRIYALKFKAFFNFEILKQLVNYPYSKNKPKKTRNFINSPYRFYRFLNDYLRAPESLSELLGKELQGVLLKSEAINKSDITESKKKHKNGISNLYSSYCFLEDCPKILENLSEFLEKELQGIIAKFGDMTKINISESKKKYLFVEFLINDSLFCLTKIVELIGSSNTNTLFSSHFMANVYQSLLNWNILYEDIYLLLRYYDLYQWNQKAQTVNFEEEKKAITSRLLKMRHKSNKTKSHNNGIPGLFENELFPLIKLWDKDKSDYSEKFFQDILKNIDKSNLHYTMNNYLAEMALKKLKETKEMHSEGKAYKNMIANMYLLDDDLNNDTCQFDFAIERYLINYGHIDRLIEELRKNYNSSAIYKVETYVKKTPPQSPSS